MDEPTRALLSERLIARGWRADGERLCSGRGTLRLLHALHAETSRHTVGGALEDAKARLGHALQCAGASAGDGSEWNESIEDLLELEAVLDEMFREGHR